MALHPWELDVETSYRIATITAMRRSHPAAGSLAAGGLPLRTRLRRGIGHGLIAAGERLAGPDTTAVPTALSPRRVTAGRAG